MTYTPNPTWQDGVGGTLIDAEALNHIEQGIVDAHAAVPSTGSVQFVAVRAGAATTLPSGYSTYPLDTVQTNIGGGVWNSGIYTIPSAGLYLCLGAVRIADNSVSRNLLVGIGTANVDAPHAMWQTNSGMRWGTQYTRLTRFNANDPVRLYIYSDGQTFTTHAVNNVGEGHMLAITKIAD